jgi:diaminohydroxyphosphoribosylaminopyrimidine deaminase/5-amino-6-(5-phosphoribosylamino)uracil reductase
MQRCLELAQNGHKSVSPNPMVGSVIVYRDKIIGEGYHGFHGGPHAEVVALSRVKDTQLLPHCTLYVNLEPCAHHGKTPPCADLIINMGIRKVVIGAQDVFPEVNGKGIAKLRNGGVEVISNVLLAECESLNRRFFTFHRQSRPYIILKWAQSADGYMARTDYSSKWISNDYSRLLVHLWRSEEASILVGYNTALHDNPQLNSRDMSLHNPVRIVLDRDNNLGNDLWLKDGTVPTLIFTQNLEPANSPFLEYISTSFRPDVLPYAVASALYERNIQSLIIEGGSSVLKLFIEEGLWDEARVFTGTQYFEAGFKAPDLDRIPADQVELKQDKLKIFYNY